MTTPDDDKPAPVGAGFDDLGAEAASLEGGPPVPGTPAAAASDAQATQQVAADLGLPDDPRRVKFSTSPRRLHCSRQSACSSRKREKKSVPQITERLLHTPSRWVRVGRNQTSQQVRGCVLRLWKSSRFSARFLLGWHP